MIKVSIIKNGIVTHQGFFENQALVTTWINECQNNEAWGLAGSYQIVEEDITQQIMQEQINQEALAYLASTDWMLLRELDGGVPMPANIKSERAAARARVK